MKNRIGLSLLFVLGCFGLLLQSNISGCSPPSVDQEKTTPGEKKNAESTQKDAGNQEQPKTEHAKDAGTELAPEKGTKETTPVEKAPKETTPTEQSPDTGTGKLPLPATPEAPKTYAAGTCPTFKAGDNTIKSDNRDRTFKLFLPPEPKGAPLLFVWHPLGGNATQMANAFSAAQIAQTYKTVVVVPQSCCSQISEWTYVGNTKPDLDLFDDLLSCVDKQYDIDNKRVYTTGFSAGSLWSSFLVVNRSEYLAAAAIFSGGVGLFNYQTPRYPTPLILAWGGTSDTIANGFINFDKMTRDFEAALKKDNHFLISCNHGKGHTVPNDAGIWGFPFIFDHTFGDGKSPYNDPSNPKRKNFPSYCTFPAP